MTLVSNNLSCTTWLLSYIFYLKSDKDDLLFNQTQKFTSKNFMLRFIGFQLIANWHWHTPNLLLYYLRAVSLKGCTYSRVQSKRVWINFLSLFSLHSPLVVWEKTENKPLKFNENVSNTFFFQFTHTLYIISFLVSSIPFSFGIILRWE